MPAQPISAISFQTARSKPSALPLSRSLRNAATGDFSCVHALEASRSIVCSSVRTAIDRVPSKLLMIEQAEHPLGNDVEIDLAGAAFDGVGFGAQHGAHRHDLRRRVAIAFP